MGKQLIYTFEDDLKKRLKDPAFKKAWEESEPEYLIATKLIEKRLAKRLSQRELAKRLNTSQAVISRLETMQGNPTLSLLKRIAKILDVRLVFQLK